MKPPYEDLSRLRAGELPPEEAAALRRRIDAEPELARAWLDLGHLIDGLGALPEIPPPPSLDARVLGLASPSRSRARRWIAGGLLLAAAALLALAVPRRDGRIVLVEGQQLIDGEVLLLAGDVPVSVDGVARITVEPGAPPARGPRPEDPMKVVAGTAAGAAVGAVVTVAVLSGTATVSPASGQPLVVEAGQTRTFRPPEAEAERAPIHGEGPGGDRIAALEAEVASLRERLAEAEFTGAVARGQIAAVQGEPVAWPKELPAAYRPEAFEANLRAEIEKLPGLALHALDCSEYPCIATLTGSGDEEDWQGKLKQIPEALSGGAYPDANVWMGIAAVKSDQGASGIAGLALTPPGEGRDPAVQTRTDWRARGMMEELEGSLGER